MSDAQALRAIAVPRPITVVLSVVAGYVDSCTYLGLFGVFVAQVTGSFVLAGALFVKTEPGALAKLLAIPFFFLAGMAVTVLVHSMRRRPRATLAWSLMVECLLLIGFLVSSWAGAPFQWSGHARRDHRAAIRHGRDGRTERARAPTDAWRRLDQCDDHEYDIASYQFG